MNQRDGPFLAEITPLFVAGPAKENAIPLAAFLGEIHKILGASLPYFHSLHVANRYQVYSAEIFPMFGIYSFITIGVIVLSAVFVVAKMGSPIM
jgi:hypothetical protein